MRFFTFLFLLFSFNAKSQNCSGPGGTAQTGVAVCGTLVFPQANVPSCTGPNIPQGNGVCPNEPVTSSNSVWYKFHCYQSGTLGFLITPNSTNDDYDWEIMDVTGHLPQDVYTMDLMISINLCQAVTPFSSITGCTAAGTSSINCGGPSNSFNSMPNLITGHDYLLMVTNWSNSGAGYNLSFSGGTTVLTNNVPPTITDVSLVNCDHSLLKVTFSEDVLCNSITPLGSEFSITNGTNVITGIISNCSNGSNSVTELTIQLQNPLPAGSYNLVVNNGTDLNTILDICQDAMPAGTQFPFTITALPTAPNVMSPKSYCQGVTAVALTASGTGLLWYATATGGTGGTVAPIPSTSTAGSTTYYVSQTIGICESTRTPFVVNINATPLAPAATSPIHYCPNDIAIAVTAMGNNLLWYNANSGGIGITTAPTPSTSTSPAILNYYVSQTQQGSTLACEGPRAEIIVNVNNNLVVNIGGDTALCEAKSLQFFPTVSPLANSYLWRSTNVSNSTIDTLTKKDASVSPVDSAVYILKATLGGCITEDTVVVKVRLKPILKTISPKIICHFDSTLINGIITHASNNLIDFSWTKIDSLTSPNALQTMAHPIITTWYKITASTNIANYGCDYTLTDSVKVIVQPIVNAFAGKDTIATKNASHILKGSGGLYYNWTSSANISNPFSQNPLVNLNDDATFYLEVSDAIGCKGYDTVFVKVYDGPTYYVPNSFTPNGDGLNDIFRAIPAGIANTTYFRVFNRSGNLVFETNQWLKGWDGTFNGKPQPVGTYVWIVAGVDKYNKKIEMKGMVNLMR